MSEANSSAINDGPWALLAAALAGALLAWRSWGLELDDAYVALRVGDNLARGLALSFNPGEAVGLHSALPYALISALLSKLGLAGVAALRLVSLLSFAAMLLATWQLLRALGAAGGGRLALLFLLPSAALAYWGVAAADPMLVTALLTGGCAAFLHEQRHQRWRGSVLLFVAAALARPSLGLAYLIWRPLAQHSSPQSSRPRNTRLLDLALFTSLFGGFLLWRWLAWGTPLLGTAWGGRDQTIVAGLEQFNQWLKAYPFLAAMLMWPLLRWRSKLDDTMSSGLRDVYRLALAAVAAAIVSGGADLPYHAAFVALMPLLTVLLATLPRLIQLPAQALVVLAVGAALWGWMAADDDGAARESAAVAAGLEVGAWAGRELPPSESIATDTPGAVGYGSNRYTLGLRDGIELPRPAGEFPAPLDRAEAVLQLRPSVVVFAEPFGSHRPASRGDEQLFANPLFRFFYGARRDARARELYYHRFEERDAALWPGAWHAKHDRVTELVAAAAEYWQAQGPSQPADPQMLAELEQEIGLASEAIENKDLARARQILEATRERNEIARLATVGGSIGYIGALEGSIPAAVYGYKEQVRLDPNSDVKRGHLRMFLRITQEQITPKQPDPTPTS